MIAVDVLAVTVKFLGAFDGTDFVFVIHHIAPT